MDSVVLLVQTDGQVWCLGLNKKKSKVKQRHIAKYGLCRSPGPDEWAGLVRIFRGADAEPRGAPAQKWAPRGYK